MNKVSEFLKKYFAYIGLGGAIVLILTFVYYMVAYEVTAILIMGLTVSFLLLAGAAFFGRDAITVFLTGRGLKHGAVNMMMTIAVIAIIAFLSVIFQRYRQTFDLTADKVYSLSPKTKRVLKSLKEPVTIINFYTTFRGKDRRNEQYRKYVGELVEKYKRETDLIKSQTIDPETAPYEARKYKLSERDLPAVIFSSGGRVIKAQPKTAGSFPGEQEFTNALIKCGTRTQKSVFFLSGHGEASIAGRGQSAAAGSILQMRKALENDNYIVQELNLMVRGAAVPETCNVLVIASPLYRIPPRELKILETYLNRGGEMILLITAQMPLGLLPTGLEIILEKYRARVVNKYVLDPRNCNQGNPFFPYIFRRRGVMHPHPLTHGMERIYAPYPLLLEKIIPEGRDQKAETVTHQELLSFSGSSYAKSLNFKQQKLSKEEFNKMLRFNKETDRQGPCLTAMLCHREIVTETKAKDKNTPPVREIYKSNIVVISSGSMIDDRVVNANVDNTNFFLNCVNYLAGVEELVSLSPKDPYRRRLSLNEGEAWFIILTSMILLPGIVLTIGILIWLRRRNN